jgi:hypothetical protein
MKIPSEPRSFQDIPRWTREVTVFLRAINPQNSPDVTVQGGSGGTKFRSRPGVAIPLPSPVDFAAQDASDKNGLNVRIYGGTVFEVTNGTLWNAEEIAVPGGGFLQSGAWTTVPITEGPLYLQLTYETVDETPALTSISVSETGVTSATAGQAAIILSNFEVNGANTGFQAFSQAIGDQSVLLYRGWFTYPALFYCAAYPSAQGGVDAETD